MSTEAKAYFVKLGTDLAGLKGLERKARLDELRGPEGADTPLRQAQSALRDRATQKHERRAANAADRYRHHYPNEYRYDPDRHTLSMTQRLSALPDGVTREVRFSPRRPTVVATEQVVAHLAHYPNVIIDIQDLAAVPQKEHTVGAVRRMLKRVNDALDSAPDSNHPPIGADVTAKNVYMEGTVRVVEEGERQRVSYPPVVSGALPLDRASRRRARIERALLRKAGLKPGETEIIDHSEQVAHQSELSVPPRTGPEQIDERRARLLEGVGPDIPPVVGLANARALAAIADLCGVIEGDESAGLAVFGEGYVPRATREVIVGIYEQIKSMPDGAVLDVEEIVRATGAPKVGVERAIDVLADRFRVLEYHMGGYRVPARNIPQMEEPADEGPEPVVRTSEDKSIGDLEDADHAQPKQHRPDHTKGR